MSLQKCQHFVATFHVLVPCLTPAFVENYCCRHFESCFLVLFIAGVVEYLLSGKVARTHIDFKDIGYEDALQKIHASNDKDSFCHDFKLNSAYEKDIMPFTNYT